jgi:hypothetical protein
MAVISISFVLVGTVLLLYYLNLIPYGWQEFAIDLWPVSLIIAGFILVRDSVLKSKYSKRYEIKKKSLNLAYTQSSQDRVYNVFFSYGQLHIRATDSLEPQLVYEQLGPMPEPEVDHQIIGNSSILKIKKLKPYFSPHFQIKNKWFFELNKDTPQQLYINLQDADLNADLRNLMIERFSLKANAGTHVIVFGKNKKKFLGQIYSASSFLSLIIPPSTFLCLKLLNPFCRVDLPQGDFKREEDGTIISIASKKDYGLIELTVDGALKQLSIDIQDNT